MFCPRLYVMSYDQKTLHENEIIKYFQNYSPGHNVLELQFFLVLVQFTISKTKRDIWYNKIGARLKT